MHEMTRPQLTHYPCHAVRADFSCVRVSGALQHASVHASMVTGQQKHAGGPFVVTRWWGDTIKRDFGAHARMHDGSGTFSHALYDRTHGSLSPVMAIITCVLSREHHLYIKPGSCMVIDINTSSTNLPFGM